MLTYKKVWVTYVSGNQGLDTVLVTKNEQVESPLVTSLNAFDEPRIGLLA